MFSNALMLVLLADHEAGDILQEDKGHLALRANLNEIGTFGRCLAKEDAVVGNDTHLLVVNTTETCHQR